MVKDLVAHNPLFRRFNRVQSVAVQKALKELKAEGRCLVVKPTGTGKTVVGMKIMAHFLKEPILWITQTEELIHQTAEDLRKRFGADKVGLFVRDEQESGAPILVASLQTIEKDEYLQGFRKRHFGLMIVDEAHHSQAPTWKKVIDYFQCNKVGLTATPYRHDGKEIEDLFGNTAFQMSYEEAKEKRLISEETYRVILTNSKIKGLRVKGHDYRAEDLDRLVVSANRNEIIVDSYKKYGRSFMRENNLPYKTICFCITVQHAIRMRELFREHGITAEILVGRAGKKSAAFAVSNRPQTETERREIYESFRKGTGPEILCVVNVLNEGKNIQDVSCLLMARPTRSGIIFQQQMGRASRRIHRKKEKFLVLDYVDLINRKYPPMTLARITGKPYSPDQIVPDYYKGKDPLIVNEYVEYLSPSHPFSPQKKWTKEKIVEALKGFYKKNRRISSSDLSPKNGLPNRTTIRRHWLTVEECFLDLGFKRIDHKKAWTREDIEGAARHFIEKQGRLLIEDLGTKNHLPSKKVVFKYWKTWKDFQISMGLRAAPVILTKERRSRAVIRGVWKAASGKYLAECYFDGRRHYIGSFSSADEATNARQRRLQDLKAKAPR